MNDKPLTWFLLATLALFGLWLWRRKRFGGNPAGTALSGLPAGPSLADLTPPVPAFLGRAG